MALSFDGSTQYLSRADAPVTAVPLSMACWANKPSGTEQGVLISIGDTAADTMFSMRYSSVEDVEVTARQAGTSGVATSSGAGTAGDAWFHACGVYRTTTSRDAYRAGANKGSNATSITPTGLDRTYIGFGANSGSTDFHAGYVAEVAIWNIALSDQDVADLARGLSPLYVHPESLVLYSPLIGRMTAENDIISGLNWTHNAGPTQVPHPRIIPMSLPKLIVPASAGHPSWKRAGGVQFMGGPRTSEGARIW